MNQKVITVTLNPSIDKTIALDRLRPYALNRAESVSLDPGGKGINVARVLHNFGIPVAATGILAGRQGRELQDRLNRIDLQCDFMTIEGETRTNLKLVDRSVGKVTEINEPGPVVTPEHAEAFLIQIEALCRQAEFIVLSGSLPPGMPDDYYATCILAVKKHGGKVLLDADGPALAEGLKAVPYAVKPNLYELEQLYRRKFVSRDEIVDAARDLVAKGIEIVVVSMGSDGAVIAGRDAVYQTGCWDIQAQSTVGAGDAMAGAMIYSMLQRKPLYDLARMATAAGTVTAAKTGTRFCTLAEVMESLEQVSVRQIL